MYDRDAPFRSDGGKNVDIVDLYTPSKTPSTDNSYAQWLTNGEWSPEKYAQYLLLKQLPVIGDYTDFLTSYYDDMSYMDQNQISWDDVRRPWKLKSSNVGYSFIRSGLNFVSKNVNRLYH